MKSDHWLGEIVTIMAYGLAGVIIGIMGIYCKVKFIDAEGEISTWHGELEYVRSAIFQEAPYPFRNDIDDICPWKRRLE